MTTRKPMSGRFGSIGLAFAALMSIAAAAGPAAADDWNRGYYGHRPHDNGFLSFGFGSQGYYYGPPPGYYYPPPPPAYYYPPPPAYYAPGLSFNFLVPLGHHR